MQLDFQIQGQYDQRTFGGLEETGIAKYRKKQILNKNRTNEENE